MDEHAGLRLAEGKAAISMRIDHDVLRWFKHERPKGYQTMMNAVLRRYMDAIENKRSVKIRT